MKINQLLYTPRRSLEAIQQCIERKQLASRIEMEVQQNMFKVVLVCKIFERFCRCQIYLVACFTTFCLRSYRV